MKKDTKTKKTSARPKARASKPKAESARALKKAAIPQPPSKALVLAKAVVEIVQDKQGLEPEIVDVRGKSSLADYFVIVSGHNIPHLRAMFDEVLVRLKKQGIMCYRRTERQESGWLVLDYVDVVIHMLLEERRQYYAIEALWSADHRPE